MSKQPTLASLTDDGQHTRLAKPSPAGGAERDALARALLEEERRHALFRRLFLETSLRHLRSGRC